jgi:hypothetical protein
MAPPYLSKSRYLNGMQCLKYLWLVVNQPESVPQPTAQTRHLFDQGHIVQEYAEKLFPDGVRVPESVFKGPGDLTGRLLNNGRTFFEAAISASGLYSRVDILNSNGNGAWDIIEVKSGTRVKDENVHDVSFQKLCCQHRSLKVDRCFLLHINNKYVKDGEIDPQKLFTRADITDQVKEVEAGIESRIQTMRESLQSGSPPDSRPGVQCNDPYECPVLLCRAALPQNNILDLYRGGVKAFDLLYSGVRFLKDIPESFQLSASQQVQKWCDANSCHHVNKSEINDFLHSLKYPVHYLDFETFSTAVPIFDGTRPYQQVPFQFSMHVVDKPGAMAWHFGYLAEGSNDPRPSFLTELAKALGKKGSIVVYNQSFEEGIMHELAKAYPENQDWIDQACTRMVDLLLPFRNFAYYHPDQKGSASIKYVLPALTGKNYDDMDIGKGDEASLAYLDMTFGKMSEAQKAKTRADLEIYCGQDTEGMIWIIDKLREMTGTGK